MPNDYENKSHLELNLTSSRNYFTRKIVWGNAEYKCKENLCPFLFVGGMIQLNLKRYKFNINYNKNINCNRDINLI